MKKEVLVYHLNWMTNDLPVEPTYRYETDRLAFDQIFRDNNAVTGDPTQEVNVRMNKRSLSVGDMIQIDSNLWICDAFGWSQVNKEDIWPERFPTPGRGTTTTSSSPRKMRSLLDMLRSLSNK